MADDDDDTDIPETGAVFTFGKSKFADNVPNKFYIRNDRVIQVACGDEHTAIVAESGRVFTFGVNDWGQLGLGHTNSTTKPTCIKSLKHEKITYAACGRSHTLVAAESGLVYSFGSNSEGQLGVEDTPGSNSPKPIDHLERTQYSMLAAGTDHSIALTGDGRVFVWGSGSEGQLGLGEECECSHPKQLPLFKHVTCVACGYYHSAIIAGDGDLYTFGESECGKLGLGDDPDDTNTPQLVDSIPGQIIWVACGARHTIALTDTGSVYTFGDGANGQLGQGTSIQLLSMPRRLCLEGRFIHCDCGDNHTAIVADTGHVYTFGDGHHGKLALGNESFANHFKPSEVKRFHHLFVGKGMSQLEEIKIDSHTSYKHNESIQKMLEAYVKVACGGCHMMILAQPRQCTTNDDLLVKDLVSPVENSFDNSGSILARNRRRQMLVCAFLHFFLICTDPEEAVAVCSCCFHCSVYHCQSPSASFNRTLPSLYTSHLPPLLSTPRVSSDLSSLSVPALPQLSHTHTDTSHEKDCDRNEAGGYWRPHVIDSIITQTDVEWESGLRVTPKPTPRQRKFHRNDALVFSEGGTDKRNVGSVETCSVDEVIENKTKSANGHKNRGIFSHQSLSDEDIKTEHKCADVDSNTNMAEDKKSLAVNNGEIHGFSNEILTTNNSDVISEGRSDVIEDDDEDVLSNENMENDIKTEKNSIDIDENVKHNKGKKKMKSETDKLKKGKGEIFQAKREKFNDNKRESDTSLVYDSHDVKEESDTSHKKQSSKKKGRKPVNDKGQLQNEKGRTDDIVREQPENPADLNKEGVSEKRSRCAPKRVRSESYCHGTGRVQDL